MQELTINEEVKLADYYDDTFLLFRILDFVSVARWNLVFRPVFSWHVWWANTYKIKSCSLKRKNRQLEFQLKVYNG